MLVALTALTALTAVVAQGGGVGVVVPQVIAAVLEQVGVGVAAFAGVDTDGRAAVQAVGVEVWVWPSSSSRVQPSRLTARRVVLVSSTHSLFSERRERSSRPGVVGRRRWQRRRADDGGGRESGGGDTTGGHRHL